jgi:hypothetical protein
LDPKKTSTVIKALHKRFPLPGLAHCKRVKKSRADNILMILVAPQAAGELKEIAAAAAVAGVPEGSISELLVVAVPEHPPLTRDQFNTATKFWPVTVFNPSILLRIRHKFAIARCWEASLLQ